MQRTPFDIEKVSSALGTQGGSEGRITTPCLDGVLGDRNRWITNVLLARQQGSYCCEYNNQAVQRDIIKIPSTSGMDERQCLLVCETANECESLVLMVVPGLRKRPSLSRRLQVTIFRACISQFCLEKGQQWWLGERYEETLAARCVSGWIV